MGTHVTDFVTVGNSYYPETTINPDSIKLKDIFTYSYTYSAIAHFQTLDGKRYAVNSSGINSSKKISITINNVPLRYSLPDAIPVLTFDAQIKTLSTSPDISYYYILNGGEVDEETDPVGSDIYTYLRSNITLKTAIESLGWETNITDAAQEAILNSLDPAIQMLTWKLRIKLDKKNYLAYVYRDGPSSTAYYNLSTNYVIGIDTIGESIVNGVLSPAEDWLRDIYPSLS